MLRVFIALSIFFFNLFACEGGYSSCVKKVKHSQTLQKKTLQIPISHNRRLVFSPNKPDAKILKHDPFLSLYIVEDTNSFKYPFKISKRYPAGLASVNNTTAIELKIKKRQVGLNQFALANTPLQKRAILTNSCCSLEGIVTERGIIEKVYIKRFIDKKDIRYADIGIRVKDSPKGVIVTSHDPFMKKNPFQKGDYILSFDGHRVKDAARLMRKILFARIGSTHNVKIKRCNKIINIKVRNQERLSGGYKVETYLDNYGLTFDINLRIIKIDKTKKSYGLLIGDRLMQVNTHKVSKQEDVMKHISDFKYHPKLLFERNDNFQFFVDMD